MITARKLAFLNGDTHYFTGRQCKRGHIAKRRVDSKQCVLCAKEISAKIYSLNKEKITSMNMVWRLANPDSKKKADKKWKSKNKQYVAEQHKAWKEKNPQKVAAWTRKRQADKLNRTPKWVDSNEICAMGEFYSLAAIKTRLTGYKWEVDHIIPLKGRNVSGLHTIYNLQVIPAIENRSKNNKFDIA